MRGILFVTLFILTARQSFAIPKCPPDDGTNGDILLRNPADCTTFYKCVYGVPYLMPCPPGLKWSEELNRCEYPEIARCVETEDPPTTISSTSTTRKPKPQRCPAVDGTEDVLLPNPADCSSFFKCQNGVPHLIYCPDNQKWNNELDRCDYPEIARCIETETSSSTTSTSTTPRPPRPDRCPAVDGPEDVLLPNPKDCGSFFKCLRGVPHLIPCPPGLEWSNDLNRCEFPETAKCPKVQPRPIRPILPNGNGCPAVDGPEDVLLPNPADCGSFFQCIGGVPVLHYCQAGLEWSVELNRCEYPEIAKCIETETSTTNEPITSGSTSSKSPTERPDHCPAENGPEDVLLPNPDDCGSFFKCLNGVPHLINCPSGQEWSIELNRCDLPEIAKCVVTGSSTAKVPTTSSPSSSRPPTERPNQCPAENGPEDVLLPNPEDCGSFFKCLNGIPHLIHCPSGQEWSIELNRCDLPEIAKCVVTESSTAKVPTTSSPSSSRPPTERPNQCPAENGPEDVLLPNPEDCGSFFKCLNGIPHLIHCPSGQEWSIELNRCDFPEIAKCSKVQPRPIRPIVPNRNGCPAVDGPEDVLLPNPADCGSFFQCVGGVPVLNYCQAGLEWSVELNRCEYPEIAKCVETGSSTANVPTTSGPTSSRPPTERPDQCPAENGPEDVLLPNPEDCGSFFKCLNGIPHLIHCPSGQEWSIELNRCDFPEIAKCVVTGSSTANLPTTSGPTSSRPPTERPDHCPAENGPEDVLLPNPEDCGSFFKCLNGIPHLIHCPSGQEWSIELNRCDFPEIAKCVVTGSSTVKVTTTSGPTSSRPPTERPDHCPAENGPEDVLLPNPEDCGSFFKCLNGIPHLIHCPSGQEWSIELNRCDFPEIAQCKKYVFKKLIFLYDSECLVENNGYDILLANPEDCSTYYQCSNGIKILKDCPEGTLWNAKMVRCDHANVDNCA